MKNWLISFLLLIAVKAAFSQDVFTVDIEEISVPGFPALHSGAVAEHNGKWIFIGGRTNGLHGFHTSDGFPPFFINNNIWVTDINTGDVWSYSADSLSDDIREAITSSNMQFYQDGNTLYMQGGYGWINSLSEFRTFPTLTAIDLPTLVDSVINAGSIAGSFRQIENDTLAITGAHLQKLDDRFYLVFGHRFDGTYSENTTGGFFTQTYSNSVRSFEINDNGTDLSVSNFFIETDTNNFHRRDYNLVPQIYPDRQEGFTAFAGVFQKGIDIPYFTTIDINASGATHIPGFNQNLSQYHSAVMPVYDSLSNVMHNIFFGGMSMYYLDSVTSELQTDSMVPFVNTISKVTRNADSSLTEFSLPVKMPLLLGSNSHFIPLTTISKYDNGIIKLNTISGRTLVGYIVGGIISPEANISATDPSISEASNRVFEVYIDNMPDAVDEIKVSEPVSMKLFPNPAGNTLNVELLTEQPENIEVSLLNSYGMKLENYFTKKSFSGKHKLTKNISGLAPGLYYVLVSTGKFSRAERLIVR